MCYYCQHQRIQQEGAGCHGPAFQLLLSAITETADELGMLGGLEWQPDEVGCSLESERAERMY